MLPPLFLRKGSYPLRTKVATDILRIDVFSVLPRSLDADINAIERLCSRRHIIPQIYQNVLAHIGNLDEKHIFWSININFEKQRFQILLADMLHQ